MAVEDSVADALRDSFGVPTDTMITLDIPLLLTRLSQVPAIPAPVDPAAQDAPRPVTPDEGRVP